MTYFTKVTLRSPVALAVLLSTSFALAQNRFAGSVSAGLGLGRTESADAGLAARTMNAASVDALVGYRHEAWVFGLHGDLRYQYQMTPLSEVNQTNLRGSGYLLGLGASYRVNKNFYTMAALDLFGLYDFAEPTSTGDRDELQKPLGLRLKAGYFWSEELPLSVDADLQWVSFQTFRLAGQNHDWRTTQTFAAVALTYHFGAPAMAGSAPAVVEAPSPTPVAEVTPSAPDLEKSLAQVGDVERTADSLKLKIEGDGSFPPGSAKMTDSARAVFTSVAEALTKTGSDTHIRVEGHTDTSGRARENQRLSEERATAVREFLIGQGLAAERIQAVGLGSQKPIRDNATKAGRAKNRRVEIHIVTPQGQQE
ncbi:MAG: OmpA family protein [Bdellovibrionaceae bacterium]|nr:OmpA family protein [Pseudobdellovibrionaceae bacterium]